jgi:uracil-DNA glycosylase
MMQPEREQLLQKLEERLRYYQDIKIGPFYRRQGVRDATGGEHDAKAESMHAGAAGGASMARVAGTAASGAGGTVGVRRAAGAAAESRPSAKMATLPVAQGPSLFEAAERVEGDTLARIRADLGDCTRCKLCRKRTNIVFGDGNEKAELVFVGEGPGHDEDLQGLPFVGRAGKLLTQMIEAMGLERRDVYIGNVVKCRPPENRTPEKDEVAACSPFLLRQIDTIRPKVIVCLGSVAAQTLLGTNRSISQFRGEWLEFRGVRLIATYHPAYLLRNPNAKGEVWKDLQKVMAVLGLNARKRRP